MKIPLSRVVNARIAALFFCVVTTAGQALAATPTPQQLDRVRQNIQALRDELNNARETRRDVRAQLAETEQHIAVTRKKIRNINADIDTNTRQVHTLLVQRRQLQASLEKHRDALARQIRSAYIVGRQDYVKMLLNQEQPMMVGRVLADYRYLDTARRNQIAGITEKVTQLRAVESAISNENETLSQLATGLSAEKTALTLMQNERKQMLSRIDRELNDKTQRLNRLTADEKRLSELLRRLQSEFNEIPLNVDGKGDFARLRGKLPWPTAGRIAIEYGKARGAGNLNWQGVVLRAEEGAAVRAVWRGRIAFSGWLNGYGQVMVIEHGDGYMSVYGYNQSLAKEVGDWTETGEIIATVGDSGGQTNAGLYFEIRHNGKPDNPAQWCTRRVTATVR